MAEFVPSTTLWNKNLIPPHNVCEVPDSPGGRISGETLIAQSDGWDWLPEPIDQGPGLAPAPAMFEPVHDAEPVKKARKPPVKSEPEDPEE